MTKYFGYGRIKLIQTRGKVMSKVVEKDEGSERKKLIIIRILQVLEEYSDVNHPLKQSEIEKILLDKYDISAERKAIGRNLQLLQDMFDKDGSFNNTTDIILETGGHKGSWLDKRLFEDSELRLLIDSVLASRHIPVNYSKDLIEKLCCLSNKYFKSRVKHIHTVSNWEKTESKSLFINIDIIDEAIEKGKKITFDYNKYGADKKLHKTTAHKENPYQLILKNQKYYLMYGSEKWKNVGFIRVDKITNINITDEPITPLREHKGYENGIDYKKIMCSLPFMFGDLVESVTFVADANAIDYVIDDFGNSAKIKDIGDNKFEISVMASPNAMEYWAMQYLNYVEIKTPVALRERIKENIKNAKERYS